MTRKNNVTLNTKVELGNTTGRVTDLEDKRLYIDFEDGTTACPTYETFNKYYRIIEATRLATDAIQNNITILDNMLKDRKHNIEDRWLMIDGKKVLYVLSDGIAIKEDIASKCNLKYKLCKYNHGFRAKIQSINEGNISKILMATLQSN